MNPDGLSFTTEHKPHMAYLHKSESLINTLKILKVNHDNAKLLSYLFIIICSIFVFNLSFFSFLSITEIIYLMGRIVYTIRLLPY